MLKNNYDWSQFTVRVAIAAPAEEVYQMWTVPEKLRKWFLLDGKIEPKKGGNYAWTWTPGLKETGKIIDIKKPAKISFTFADSVCEVSIKKNKRGSMVILHQHNIPVTEHHKSGVHLNCNSGWTFFLINLKTYMEYGIDLREKDPDFAKNIASVN